MSRWTAFEVVRMTPFASEQKLMGVVVKLPNGRFRLFTEGASEINPSLDPTSPSDEGLSMRATPSRLSSSLLSTLRASTLFNARDTSLSVNSPSWFS